MTHWRLRMTGIALMFGLNTVLLASCAVTDGGYVDSPNVRIGVDYYDPWFGDYGGWGPGYRVGPIRQIGPRHDGDGGHQPRGYRPAPGTHQIPSIPSQPHPGGPRRRR